MSLVTQEIRSKANIYHGKEACEEQAQILMKEIGLPNGLLPLGDAEECGYVPETGFVWLRQKIKTEHKFTSINKLVSYGTEVTAYAEPCKIKKLTGVKAKEFMLWITICEISVPEPNAEKITFKSSAGPSRTFPFGAFVVEEKPKPFIYAKDNKEDKEATGNLSTAGAATATVVKEAEEVKNDLTAATAVKDVKELKDLKDGLESAPATKEGKEVQNFLAAAPVVKEI